MPGWPSPAERRALDAFPEQIGPEDLDEHFKLSPADMRFALRHRGDSRLGVAVQLRAAQQGRQRVYWNTRYIAHALETLERQGHTMRDDDIRHIHPVHYEHINPFGHYRFDTRRGPAKGRLRPLRPVTYTSRATPATNATATNA